MNEKVQSGRDATDRFLGKPFFYFLFVLIAVRANDLKKAEPILYRWLGVESDLPILRLLLWALCAVMIGFYLYRLARGRIRRNQPMILCLLALHAVLAVMTLIYRGASGYWLHWATGLALMLALDMGLQRERRSVLNGFALALSLWVYVNIPVRLLYPGGINEPVPDVLFVPEWLTGNRVFYYRIAFPALAFEMMYAQFRRGHYTARTWICLAAVTLTVALQRGVMLGVSVALFIALQYFHIQEHFAFLIEGGMGKDMTLSGRTIIWTEALKIIKNYPLTGVGLLPVEYQKELFTGPYPHTHNQLLEILMHGGVVALIPYLAMIGLATRAALKHRDVPAVKTAAILLMTFIFMGAVDIFHNEPIYYPLFMLLADADRLEKGPKLPCLSLGGRLRSDARGQWKNVE